MNEVFDTDTWDEICWSYLLKESQNWISLHKLEEVYNQTTRIRGFDKFFESWKQVYLSQFLKFGGVRDFDALEPGAKTNAIIFGIVREGLHKGPLAFFSDYIKERAIDNDIDFFKNLGDARRVFLRKKNKTYDNPRLFLCSFWGKGFLWLMAPRDAFLYFKKVSGIEMTESAYYKATSELRLLSYKDFGYTKPIITKFYATSFIVGLSDDLEPDIFGR